jgi:XTP/dITP diphosphohydrolase
LEEFQVEIAAKSEYIEEEFGDLLFSLVNYARFIDISPENALAKTNQKFIRRFQLMEETIREDKKKIEDMHLEEMDVYWEKAKINLKNTK